MKKVVFITYLFFFIQIFGFTQTMNLELAEFTITSSFNKPPSSSSFIIKHQADSNNLLVEKSVAEVLQNDGVYLKAYNSGGLVTMGNRGFGASSTKIFWNGFLLNSPLNGTFDLNLQGIYPTSTEVIFNKSNSPVEGNISGAGGSVWINEVIPSGKETLRGAFSIGSFSTYKGNAGYTLKRNKFTNNFQIGYISAKNDYWYRPVTGFNPNKERLQNADIRQFNVSNATDIRLNKSKFEVRLHYSNSARGIPPPITANGPVSFQTDQSFKGGLAWITYINAQSVVSFNTAVLYDILNYFPVRSIASSLNYHVTSLPFSFRWEYRRWNHKLNVHLNQTYYHVQSSEVTAPDEFLHIGTIEFQKDEPGWLDYGFNVQQMIRNGNSIKPSFRLFGGTKLGTDLKWTLSYAETRQMPTINDRYWPLSGNPQLKYETNKSIELGIYFKKKIHSNWNLSSSLALFNNVVDDWIGWIQVNGDFWRPFNVQKVRSQGIDFHNTWKWKIRPDLALELNYNLNIANPIVLKKYLGNPAQVGKRLIYVPISQQAITLPIIFRSFTLKPSWRHVSSRYTTADNSEDYALESFVLFDVEGRYRLGFKQIKTNMMVKIENVFNRPYEMIAYRPMPGRYVEIGFGFGL